MKNICAVLTILLIFLGTDVEAQEWIRYTKDCCNLKSNNITSVVIDSSGGKWFGTDNGLMHFDGTNWTNYQKTTDGNSIPSNQINDLAMESSLTAGERIWIATDNGAVVVDSIFGELIYDTTYQEVNSDLLSNNVMTIFIDNNNVKWFGTDKV
ncbi:MAG: hypothetical protein R3250_18440, partial [Melioribacteraceae bacterium]|nr:hypothetical protein [Melioribacteraceae bacterium]